MSKQFKFKSHSALSFSVNVHGRQTYVNFSPSYRGLSFFITTDEALAAKVRAHRWFREGRITETVEEILPPKEPRPYVQPPVPERKKYTILGKLMASSPQQKQQPAQSAAPEAPESPVHPVNLPDESAPAIVAEEVSSFMEAKEFFIANYGLQRAEVSTKDAVAALCRQFNVSFPNYPL